MDFALKHRDIQRGKMLSPDSVDLCVYFLFQLIKINTKTTEKISRIIFLIPVEV